MAEVRVEGEAVGRADGPGWWGGEVDQVAAGGLDDTGAGVSVAGVAVAVVDEQDRVAQPARSELGVAKWRGGVEPGADDRIGCLVAVFHGPV